MVRRTLTGIIGAAVLMLSLASTALADEANGNQTFASGNFTRTAGGIAYAWSIQANRDTVEGTSLVFASYNASVDTICPNGEQGALFILFDGRASVPFLIPANLKVAVAAARIHGTETTSDSCTGLDTVVEKSYSVAVAMVATSAAQTFADTKCINSEQSFSSSFTVRNAAGAAVVNGRAFSLTDEIIGHQVWSTQDDPSCADA